MKNNKLGKWASYVAVAVMALGAGSALAAKSKTKKELSGVVNINTATAQQLDLLPGVGEKAAKRIIELRAVKPFAKLEELRKVKGFGPKKLEKMRPFVAFSGSTTATLKKVQVDATASSSSPPSAQGRRASQK